MPCGISMPSAQLRKSWSNACGARLHHVRPWRNSRPRNTLPWGEGFRFSTHTQTPNRKRHRSIVTAITIGDD